MRSLVVGELDDRDGRVGRAPDHGRIDDLRRGGGGGEQGEAEGGRAEASPPAQAARPSSERAVMMYVPLFSSRSSVTIFCLAASSSSFEKVE